MSRGRNARTPLQVDKSGWLDIAARIGASIGRLHIGLIAAGVAFYGLLSLVPTLTAAVAMVGLFYDPATLIDQAQWLLDLLPPAAAELIAGQLAEVSGAAQGSLGFAAIVSLAIALWSSSTATSSLVEGLNMIYEETDTRSFVKNRLMVIGLTIAMILGLALTLIIVAAVPIVLSYVPVDETASIAAHILRWVLVFAVGVLGIAALYRVGPDRRDPRWRWVTPGALVGCVLWVAGTFAFSTYVQTFGNYNETFGALAGIIVLLTWLWLSAFVVLLGALIDAETESQIKLDTTVGPDRPMGERGAVKADNLGAARGENEEKSEPV